MIAKCQCQQCGGNVEFEASEFELSGETSHRRLGQTIDCPHCGKPTQLYMNRAEFSAPPAQKPPVSRMIACPDCAHAISRDAWFCFECGRFHGNLRRIVWSVLGWAALFALVCAVIGWLISAVLAAGQ